MFSWIANFFSDRTMKVKVNDSCSQYVPMTSGVPQGSVLGPELFKLYINDLPSVLNAGCLLYADDLKLWMEVNSIEEADQLQDALNALDSWSNTWFLPINKDKCAVLPIGATEPLGTYHIGGHLLRVLSQEKDLGVLVSSDLKTTADTLKKVATATRIFGSIRRSFSQMTPEIFRLLFSSHVRSILEYGLPAVYPTSKHETDLIEKVQRRGSKSVLQLRDLTYTKRLEHMKLFSMEYRRRRGDLIYTRRIMRGELGEEVQHFFQPNTDSGTRGHQWKLMKPRRLRANAKMTLSTRVVNDWNNLPASIVSATSEASFKTLLDAYLQKHEGACCSLHR